MIKRFTGIVGAVVLTVALATFTASALDTSAQAGVKPANNTGKGTQCTTGGGGSCTASNTVTASSTVSAGKSDASKRYGNGKTAAQIATANGGPAGTHIHGPGNSQPDKVATCLHPLHGNGGGVDVHAVKNYSSTACTSTTSPTSTKTSTSTSVTVSGASLLPTLGTTTTTVAGGSLLGAIASSLAGKAGVHGVLGASATRGGVLGALAAKRTGTLPFTGLPGWIVALIGLGLLTFGLGLRRQERVTT